MPPPLRRQIAGIVATACAVTQMLVQLCLALGVHWRNEATWGGASTELSTELRSTSAVAVVVWAFVGSILVQQAGFRDFGYSESFCRKGTCCLIWLLLFESALTFASRSHRERYPWGLFPLVFAFSCLVLVKDDRQGSTGEGRSEEVYLFLRPEDESSYFSGTSAQSSRS
jgi:peptidoglycan/LPS O-acetylase OafA/YrhL